MQAEIRQVSDDFSVSAQLTEENVRKLAGQGREPSRLACILKEKILPPVYWKAMLKGKEWMVDPEHSKAGKSSD